MTERRFDIRLIRLIQAIQAIQVIRPAHLGVDGALIAEFEIPLHELRRTLPGAEGICFNGRMASPSHTSTGRSDLEPFWPSRQDHDFDRVCCRATNAPAL
ncbi:hypothetical protein ACFV7Q_18900 [Streptomyces sp. NPDC059851]|uniref:hypothetical protein n=1 Tax=Streptomyces sp. NPDC059851 TaxID=3346971 RepID=UPI0036549A9B